MSHPLHIPKLGLTMEEATIVAWLCERGARIARDQPYLTIETDKITYDVTADAEGYLEPVAPVQAVLKVGDLVGYLHATEEAARAGTGAIGHGGRRLSSPLARRLAAEHGLQFENLPGSGPGGVIRRRDVEQALASRGPAVRAAGSGVRADGGATQRRPMTAMRRAIVQRMMQSLQTTAQMTGFGRVDMTPAVAWRAAVVARQGPGEVRITYTDIVTKASACVLRELPEMNSYIDGDDIVTWSDVNIGIAVAVDAGLVVPVIRQADRLPLEEIAARRQVLIDRARSGRLERADVEGGTFTVSNFGSYDGDFETPVLNAPQSALLGIGRITDEPAVRDGQIVIRQMMMLSLTFDHRLIDGALAGRFRARLRELLGNPALLQGWLKSGAAPEVAP